MFAFQWREFSPPLSPAHRIFQRDHRQKRDSRGIPPQQTPPPPPLGSLANERADSSDVTLWHCTFWSGKFASISSYSIVKACSLSSSIMTLWYRPNRYLNIIKSSFLLNHLVYIVFSSSSKGVEIRKFWHRIFVIGII